jgi:phosphatidylinositol dimannoside acyltransferase
LGFERVSATYKTGSALFRGLPRPVAEASARYGSRVVALASGERRMLTERNLQRVHGPDFTGAPLREAVFQTFESYARYWVDSFRLPGMSHDEIDAGFGYEGYEHIGQALTDGVGPVIVLPHLGGWEWAAYWLTQIIGVRVTAVVEPVHPPELFEFFIEFRKALGLDVVPLGPSAGAEVLKAIKANHVTVLLADRDILGNGIEVDFFGERTTLPPGPVTVALRSGAPLIPAGVYFRGDGHHAVVRPPMDTSRRGRFREDVERITQDMANELESLIRIAPEQWHLQQPNWPSDHDALEAMRNGGTRPGAA